MINSLKFLSATACLAAIHLAGCSPSSGTNGNRNPLGNGSGGLDSGTGLGGAGGSVFGGNGSSSNNSGGDTSIGVTTKPPVNIGPDGSCAALPFSAEQVVKKIPITVNVTEPIDLYIMFDQSLSMTCAISSATGAPDRWDTVKAALQGFIQAPGSAGTSVGIQYFGNNGLFSSCTPADYETPDVEIAPLPSNATPLVNSLNGHNPTTNTPTPAALSGAINHALAWKTSHPDHEVAVILVTDGEPNACGANVGDSTATLVADVANIASVGWGGGKGVRTFVVGITSPGQTCAVDPGPPNQADLDSVAKAGGTNAALIVDLSKDASKQLSDELNQARQQITVTSTKTVVTSSKLACEYNIPPPPDGVVFDPAKVNVQFTSRGGVSEKVFQSASLAACASTNAKSWYYDDPTKPTKILMCPKTCKSIDSGVSDAGLVSIDAGADAPRVDVLLGCASLEAPPA
jgi:hypothetical protein